MGEECPLNAILHDWGYQINAATHSIHFEEEVGTFEVSLKTGEIFLIPTQCKDCKRVNCLDRKRPVCINPCDQEFFGWTNTALTQFELFLLAKIFALRQYFRTSDPTPYADYYLEHQFIAATLCVLQPHIGIQRLLQRWDQKGRDCHLARHIAELLDYYGTELLPQLKNFQTTALHILKNYYFEKERNVHAIYPWF